MAEVVVTDEFKAWYENLFDAEREAVLLLGGDKTGHDRFYDEYVPKAETIWERYLAERGPKGQE